MSYFPLTFVDTNFTESNSIKEREATPFTRVFTVTTLVIIFLSTYALGAAQAAVHNVLITGVVVDSNGSVVTNAQIAFRVGDTIVSSTRTDTQGHFELSAESANGFVEVTAVGFESTTLSLDTTAQFPLRIVLTPESISAEVTITATRTATRLDETAANVVQLNTSDLKTTAAATLDDTLRQVAGFSLFRRSGSRTANPTAQGVSLRATGGSGASRALVLADGIPLTDPFGGWVYWDRVPRESISQVDVLLGGASHLYGNAALGGVIDIATKRPRKNTLSLSTSFGNETTPDASLFAAAVKNSWTGSIAAEFFHTEGYVLVPQGQRGLVDTPAGTRDLSVNLRLEKRFGENRKLFGTASFFGEARANGTPLQTNRTHLRQFVFGGSWQSLSAGSFSARAYGGTQVYDQNFSSISNDRNLETLTRIQRVPAQLLGFSFQWSRLIGRRQTIVAGIDGREVRGASDETAYVNGRPSSLVGVGGRENSDGGYVEDLIRLGSRIFLNFGARLDGWRNSSGLSASRPITGASSTSVNLFPDRTETAFSPHLSLVLKIHEQLSVMASISRAFRAPTLNELYRSFRVGNVLTLANENLRAERLTGGEVGFRTTSKRDRAALRANLFWNDITRPVANVTLTTTPALITRQRQNLGRTRSKGLELHGDVKLIRAWSLSNSYMFADARVREFPANVLLEGLLLPQVPRHQLTMQTRYEKPATITVAFQGRISSSQFDDDQNQFQLNRYFTLDGFVSRRFHRSLEGFLAVENIFNQRYEVGKTPVTTLGPPILFRVGLRVELGHQ